MDFIYKALQAQPNFNSLMVMLLEDLPISALRRFLLRAVAAGELPDTIPAALENAMASYRKTLQEAGFVITSDNGQYYWTLPNGDAGENWYERIDAEMDAWETYLASHSAAKATLPDITGF